MRRALLVALAGVLAVVSPAAAAEHDWEPAAQPVMIDLRVAVDGQEPFLLTVWSGQAATLRSAERRLFLAITPTVRDLAGGDVTLRVEEVRPVRYEALARVGRATEVLAKAGFHQPLGHYPVTVAVLGIRRGGPVELLSFLKSESMFLGDGMIKEASCCVSCGEVTLCGCKVNASCGFCCDDCCGGGGGGGFAR